MKKLADFLQRERLYLLLLVFVVLMSALVFVRPGGRPVKSAASKPAAAAALTTVEARRTTASEDTAARRAEVERIFAGNGSLAIVFSLASLLIIAVLLLGIAVDLIFILSRLSRREFDIATYRPHAVLWGSWDVAKVIILFLFFGYILIMIESALVRVAPLLRQDNFRMIFNSAVLDTLGVVFILHFSIGRHGEKPISLGLSLKNFAPNVFYGVVGYIAIIPVLVAILAAVAFFISVIKYVPEKQAVVELFLKEKDAAFLFYTGIFAAVFGPIIEELFFRGFMYNAFKKRLGILGAMLVTAAMFAALHAHAVGFLPIMALGMLLAYLYEKTGTLVSSITVHVMHNLAMVSLVFLIKQLGVG